MKINLGQNILDGGFMETLNNFIADYQAKLGNFLVQKQTLIALKNRTAKLSGRADTATLAGLNADITTQIKQQDFLEAKGFGVLTILNSIKENPLVANAIKGKYPNPFDVESYKTIEAITNTLKNVAGMSGEFFSAVDTHIQNINIIADRVHALDGLGGAGTQASVSTANINLANLAKIPTIAISLAFSGLFLIYRVLRTERKLKKAR